MALIEYQNPHAEAPLKIVVLANVSDEELLANIDINSKRPLPWLGMHKPIDQTAIVAAGGPSLTTQLLKIRSMHSRSHLFACNGASPYLRSHDIIPDCQIIIDATIYADGGIFDAETELHLLAAQCKPELFDEAKKPVLMQLAYENMEDHLPKERVKEGGYVLVGGGYNVGNSALSAIYALGYRDIHCFGYDCNYSTDGACHAYPQRDDNQIIEAKVDGKTFMTNFSMKAGADRFQETASELVKLGCSIEVHGEGLLQAMWRNRHHEQSADA